MNKKLLILTITLFVFVLTSHSKVESISFSSHVADKYLAFGSGGILHDDVVVQSSIDVNFENGMFVGIWASNSFNGRQDFGDEIDYTIGWSGKLFEDYSANICLSYFNEPDLSDHGVNDVIYTKVDISRPFGETGINCGLKIRNYITMPGTAFEGGWLIGPYLSKGFQLTEKLSFFQAIEFNWDDGGFGLDNGLVINPFSSLSYQLNDSIRLDIIQANVFIPMTNDSRESDVAWSTGFSVTF